MLAILEVLLILGLLLLVAIGVARFLFALPSEAEQATGAALPGAADGPLCTGVGARLERHTGRTGIASLSQGADAFAARVLLADAAASSIDAQYYIWQADMTGLLLFDALRRAADRGVKVRLLLDDNGTSGVDAHIAALDAHPLIEVRLYNPFNLRRFKMLSYAFDFFRLNRRMHNKSFTVDALATIMGGRNIGDEYFGTGLTPLYFDLDVLAVGRVVPDVTADFDRYWNAPAVHRAATIVAAYDGGDPVGEGLLRLHEEPQLDEYRARIAASQLVRRLADGTLDLEWTDAVLVSDDPAKGEGAVPRDRLLATTLARAVGRVESRFDGVSPYFVPGSRGVNGFAGMEHEGIDVRMLTNSLEATDVLPVHAGYARRRKAMLASGVELFELRREAAPGTPRDSIGIFGSSGASLHAKTFAVDGRKIYVGSFNFDPRSVHLNTEMGLLIDSPRMAQTMHDAFDQGLGGLAWKVERRGGKLIWTDPSDARAPALTREPGTSLPRRIALSVIGWLPVEWLL